MALRTIGKGSSARAVTYKELEQIGVDPRKPIDNPDDVLRKLGKGGEPASGAASKFTQDELIGMNSTIKKLNDAPKDVREKQIASMKQKLQSLLAEAKQNEAKALKHQADFAQKNPSAKDNFFNAEVEKMQARLKTAKHDWNKFAFVVNQVHGK